MIHRSYMVILVCVSSPTVRAGLPGSWVNKRCEGEACTVSIKKHRERDNIIIMTRPIIQSIEVCYGDLEL